ncbi:chlorophyllase-1-like [Ricinus communis]|uniref:chlorophyllase-1-like n=1 Tax=Ricinus communis TaxID=3988 RepID=UPI00201AB8F3|nr:chlorophyllase-1-like [Ricinus communis]
MVKLQITLLAILLASLSEAKPVLPTLLETNNQAVTKAPGVFETGYFPTELNNVKESELAPGSPPKPLLLARPTVAGKYPVILFIHGTCLLNSFYSDVLVHVASHGFIVVAPQIYTCTVFGAIPVIPIDGQKEVDLSTEVANWLPSGLKSVLKGSVQANLDKLVISGHSRGGKTAFAMQLGYSTDALTTKFSALVGLDPVAGTSKESRTDPKVLTYIPHSFNLSIPVSVIGTGLGSQPSCWLVCPACAPDEVNHAEFYNECRPPASHFVATDYGHMDMLNDDLSGLMGIMAKSMCKNSNKPKDPMRKTVGGIIVAFLKAYFYGNSRDYNTILQDPSVSPATLYPVESMKAKYLAQA